MFIGKTIKSRTGERPYTELGGVVSLSAIAYIRHRGHGRHAAHGQSQSHIAYVACASKTLLSRSRGSGPSRSSRAVQTNRLSFSPTVAYDYESQDTASATRAKSVSQIRGQTHPSSPPTAGTPAFGVALRWPLSLHVLYPWRLGMKTPPPRTTAAAASLLARVAASPRASDTREVPEKERLQQSDGEQ